MFEKIKELNEKMCDYFVDLYDAEIFYLNINTKSGSKWNYILEMFPANFSDWLKSNRLRIVEMLGAKDEYGTKQIMSVLPLAENLYIFFPYFNKGVPEFKKFTDLRELEEEIKRKQIKWE